MTWQSVGASTPAFSAGTSQVTIKTTANSSSGFYAGATNASTWGDLYQQRYYDDRDDRRYYEERLREMERHYRIKLEEARQLRPGMELRLPDDCILTILANGNWQIDDSKKKITRRGNGIREFNKYLNSSDLLEEFFEYLATHGITKRTLDGVTIRHFVAWLVVRSAEEDKETVDAESQAVLLALTDAMRGSPVQAPSKTAQKSVKLNWIAGLWSAIFCLCVWPKPKRTYTPLRGFFDWVIA